MDPKTLIDKCKELWPEVYSDFTATLWGDTPDTISRIRQSLLNHAAGKCAICKDCELHKNSNMVVWGEGLASSPIMLIGNTMDEVSSKTGQVFAGGDGASLLNSCIEKAELIRQEKAKLDKVMPPLYIVHTRKCPGESGDLVCWKWLQLQLWIVQPLVVVLMGSAAAAFVYDSLTAPKAQLKHGAADMGVVEGDVALLKRAGRLPERTQKVFICGSPNIAMNVNASPDMKLSAYLSLERALVKARSEVENIVG